MIKILTVSIEDNSFEDLTSEMKMHNDINLFQVRTSDAALNMASDNSLDLVISDEDLGDITGLEFVSRLLKVNPMVNSALVSSLSPEEFHETSEGLGIMAQLPKNPGREDVQDLLEKLKQIKGMLS